MSQTNITFFHVTITVPAEDAKQAYTKLCEAFAAIGGDWETDTFWNPSTRRIEDTEKLFPVEGETQ